MEIAINVVRRNNIKVLGHGPKTLVLAHGYGCDQNMWSQILPSFLDQYQIILFDHVGSGQSDTALYDRVRYGTLHGYAEDLLEICQALDVSEATFVGHSVSATIGALASIKNPTVFQNLVLVAPSPCFVNDSGYTGGFERSAIHDMLSALESNFTQWSQSVAPLIMGQKNSSDLSQQLMTSFCNTKPEISKHFAQVTFLADHRLEMSQIPCRTLILQCSEDALAPLSVGQFLNQMIPQNDLVQLKATGHCPHMSAPEETVAATQAWLNKIR